LSFLKIDEKKETINIEEVNINNNDVKLTENKKT